MSVPVLSEKMYSICPNSSFSVVVLALAGVSVSAWYMFRSQPMMKLSASRITSTLKHRVKGIRARGHCVFEGVKHIFVE